MTEVEIATNSSVSSEIDMALLGIIVPGIVAVSVILQLVSM